MTAAPEPRRRRRSRQTPRSVRIAIAVAGLAVSAGIAGVVVWRWRGPEPVAEAARLRAAAAGALERGDPEAAETFARAAVALAPTPENRTLLGEALLRAGRRDEGVRCLEEAIAGARDGGAPALVLAKWVLDQGDAASAERLVERATKSAAHRANGLRLRATARLALGHPAAALDDLVAVTDESPDDAASALLAGQVAAFLGRAGWDRGLATRSVELLRLAARRAAAPDRARVRAAAHLESDAPALALADVENLAPEDAALLRASALAALDRPGGEAALRDRSDTLARAVRTRLLVAEGHAAAAEAALGGEPGADDPPEITLVRLECREARAFAAVPQDLVAAALAPSGQCLVQAESAIVLPVLARGTGPAAARLRLGRRGAAVLAELTKGTAGAQDREALAADVAEVLAGDRRDPLALAFRGALELNADDTDAAIRTLESARLAAVLVASDEAVRRIDLLRALTFVRSGRLTSIPEAAVQPTATGADEVTCAVRVHVLAALGRRADAARVGRDALDAFPSSATIAFALAEALDAPGPSDASLRARAEARLRLARGETAEALDAVRGIAAEDADASRALVAEALGRTSADAAVELARNPDSWRAAVTRAALLRHAGRHAEARRVLDESESRTGSVPVSLELITLLAAEGDFAAAQAAGDRALARAPGDPLVAAACARVAAAAGRDEVAGQRLRAVLDADATDAVKLAVVRSVLARVGCDSATAAAVARWADGLAPGPDGAAARLYAALARGDLDTATAATDAARAEAPADAAVVAAVAALRAGQIDAARAALDALPAGAVLVAEFRVVRSLVEARLASRALAGGSLDEARAHALAALAAQPGDLAACVALAHTIPAGADGVANAVRSQLDRSRTAAGPLFHGAWLRLTGRAAEAVQPLDEATARAPSHRLAAAYLVDTAIVAGEHAAAAVAAERYLATSGDRALGAFLVGRAAEARRDRTAAERAYRASLEADSRALAPLTRLVQVLLDDGRTADARRVLDDAARPGGDPGRASVLSALRAAAGDPLGAIAGLDELTASGGRDAWTSFLRGRCLESTGDHAGAAAAFDEAARLAPRWDEPRCAWVRTRAAAGRWDEVRARADAETQARPEDPVGWCMRASSHEARGEFADAEAAYRRAIAADAACVVALNNLAWLLSEDLGRPKDAVDPARRARTLRPTESSIADTFGWVLYRAGDARAAVPHLAFAARERGRDVRVLLRYAQALVAAGDVTVAAGVLDDAARLAPDDREVRALRDRVGGRAGGR